MAHELDEGGCAKRTGESRQRQAETSHRSEPTGQGPVNPSRLSNFFYHGSARTSHDEVAQTLIDVEAPSTGTFAVAFDCGHKADVGEAQLGPVCLPGDVEDDVSVLPLAPF